VEYIYIYIYIFSSQAVFLAPVKSHDFKQLAELQNSSW